MRWWYHRLTAWVAEQQASLNRSRSAWIPAGRREYRYPFEWRASIPAFAAPSTNIECHEPAVLDGSR
jgi:hypothetical protein